MGNPKRHVIIVTSEILDLVTAHAKAVEFGNTCSEIVRSPINDVRTFMVAPDGSKVAPDGSKEGWPESDQGDAARAAFIDWLRSQEYEDHSSPYEWIEVFYHDGYEPARVERSSERWTR